MEHGYCLNEAEYKKVLAELSFAKCVGLIEVDDFDGLERRRIAKNAENMHKQKNGELVYGVISFSKAAYLQYERTRFKLDFVEGTKQIKMNYSYKEITEEEKRSFYKSHRELFTRYFGDLFSYDEVEMIIEKRIREAEYEKNVENVLCQLQER